MDVSDSYNSDSSQTGASAANGTGSAATANVFGDGALVASSNLASYVTGSTVTFRGADGEGAAADNSLTVSGSAFQNFAGMQALNQNTGVGASQNASVNVTVSTRDVAF